MKPIHDPRYGQLVERLIAHREEFGVTQTDLAGLLNKQQSYVAKVENFDRRIDVVEIADRLTALRTFPQNFHGGIDWWN